MWIHEPKLISTLGEAVDETKGKEHIKKWMRQDC